MNLKSIKIKAVAAGFLTDIVGSVAVGVALAVFVAVVASNSGDTSPEHSARLSLPNGFSNSLAVGLLSILLGIILAISAPGSTPIWKLLCGLILTVPAAFAGGRIAARFSLRAHGPTNLSIELVNS